MVVPMVLATTTSRSVRRSLAGFGSSVIARPLPHHTGPSPRVSYPCPGRGAIAKRPTASRVAIGVVARDRLTVPSRPGTIGRRVAALRSTEGIMLSRLLLGVLLCPVLGACWPAEPPRLDAVGV